MMNDELWEIIRNYAKQMTLRKNINSVSLGVPLTSGMRAEISTRYNPDFSEQLLQIIHVFMENVKAYTVQHTWL